MGKQGAKVSAERAASELASNGEIQARGRILTDGRLFKSGAEH